MVGGGIFTFQTFKSTIKLNEAEKISKNTYQL